MSQAQQDVVLSLLGEPLGGINNKDIRIFSFLPQYHDNGGNARSEKNVGRKADNGIYMILFNQILTDIPLFAAAKKNP